MRYDISTGIEHQQMKFRKLLIASIAALGLVAAVALPALAAPGDNGAGYGGCVDNLYGNATNDRPSGHGVLPSQSPGPWVNTGYNEPPRNDRTDGTSVGEVMQVTTDLGFNGQESMEIICTFP
jgi:hypothetical protein